MSCVFDDIVRVFLLSSGTGRVPCFEVEGTVPGVGYAMVDDENDNPTVWSSVIQTGNSYTYIVWVSVRVAE